MIIYTLLFIIGAASFVPTSTNIDPAFEYYARTYTDLSKINLSDKNLTVEFADLETPVLGQCQIHRSFFRGIVRRSIKIDRRTWQHENEKVKIILFLHEMLHCVELKDHTEEELPDGCPASMMNPIILPDACIDLHLEHYLKEVAKP